MRRCFALPVLVAAILAATPAFANLLITPIFDSSITSDPNATSIEGAIDGAISVFESTYTNPIDVLIYFQEGSGLGGSNYAYTNIPYQTFYNQLVAENANPVAIAGLAANGGTGPDNPVTGSRYIEIKSANAKALEITANGASNADCYLAAGSGVPKQCTGFNNGTSPVDGIISLNTSITYPGSPGSTLSYGLMSTAAHEIDEILGLGSALANTTSSSSSVNVNSANPAPEDLFRYGSNGSRIFSVNCAAATTAFFSYNGSTDLAQFNNACSGADFGDWQSNPLPPGVAAQVQDAFAESGTQPLYGANEIAALSAIGYTVAPEPGTWILLVIALPVFAFGLRLTGRRAARATFAPARVPAIAAELWLRFAGSARA